MQQLIGFHGLFREADERLVFEAADAAANETGMSLLSATTEPWPTRVYGRDDRPSVDFSFKPSDCEGQVVMGPIEGVTFTGWGSEVIAGLLTRMSRRTNVVLGRTFRGGAGGHGLVQKDELAGDLKFVDWYQYLSASIVSRWGAARLTEGPFHRTELFDDGSMVLLLGADPFQGMMSRKKAAEYLGIKLRPLMGKDFRGNPIELEWQ